MADTRARAPLNGKRIDLAALSDSLGIALTADVAEVVATEGSGITEAALVAAVEAAPALPALAVTEANGATLRERAVAALDANAAFLAIPNTPTNAQVLAQVKVLTKEASGLIRLLLGRLDSVEGT